MVLTDSGSKRHCQGYQSLGTNFCHYSLKLNNGKAQKQLPVLSNKRYKFYDKLIRFSYISHKSFYNYYQFLIGLFYFICMSIINKHIK